MMLKRFSLSDLVLTTPLPMSRTQTTGQSIVAAQVEPLPAKLCVFKAVRAVCSAPTMAMIAQVVVVILKQSACVLDSL